MIHHGKKLRFTLEKQKVVQKSHHVTDSHGAQSWDVTKDVNGLSTGHLSRVHRCVKWETVPCAKRFSFTTLHFSEGCEREMWILFGGSWVAYAHLGRHTSPPFSENFCYRIQPINHSRKPLRDNPSPLSFAFMILPSRHADAPPFFTLSPLHFVLFFTYVLLHHFHHKLQWRSG